jgi:hypothetical protein
MKYLYNRLLHTGKCPSGGDAKRKTGGDVIKIAVRETPQYDIKRYGQHACNMASCLIHSGCFSEYGLLIPVKDISGDPSWPSEY